MCVGHLTVKNGELKMFLNLPGLCLLNLQVPTRIASHKLYIYMLDFETAKSGA